MFSIQIIGTLIIIMIIIGANADDAMNISMEERLSSIDDELAKKCNEKSTKIMVNKTVDDEGERCHCVGYLIRKCIKDFCYKKDMKDFDFCKKEYNYVNVLKCPPMTKQSWVSKISPIFCSNLPGKSSSTGGIPLWAMIVLGIVIVVLISCLLLFVFLCSSGKSTNRSKSGDMKRGQRKPQSKQEVSISASNSKARSNAGGSSSKMKSSMSRY